MIVTILYHLITLNFKKRDKIMYISTEALRNRLAHCYGRNTVTVTHYNGNNFIQIVLIELVK